MLRYPCPSQNSLGSSVTSFAVRLKLEKWYGDSKTQHASSGRLPEETSIGKLWLQASYVENIKSFNSKLYNIDCSIQVACLKAEKQMCSIEQKTYPTKSSCTCLPGPGRPLLLLETGE